MPNRIRLRVRTYEVDRQNIVHNAVYLQYFETGRVEFFRAVGLLTTRDSFVTNNRFVVARNEIDYRAPAFFDDEVEISTTVEHIGRTSLTMKETMVRVAGGTLLAEGKCVFVHLDVKTNKPEPIPEEVRKRVEAFEKKVFMQ